MMAKMKQGPTVGNGTAYATATQDTAKPVWMTERQVAERLGVSVKKLQKDRWQGGRIPFLKGKSFVRYHIDHVLAWEQAHMRSSTSVTVCELASRPRSTLVSNGIGDFSSSGGTMTAPHSDESTPLQTTPPAGAESTAD